MIGSAVCETMGRVSKSISESVFVKSKNRRAQIILLILYTSILIFQTPGMAPGYIGLALLLEELLGVWTQRVVKPLGWRDAVQKVELLSGRKCKSADQFNSFLIELEEKCNLDQETAEPVWTYLLSEGYFSELKDKQSLMELRITTKNYCHFAEFSKKLRNGGSISKNHFPVKPCPLTGAPLDSRTSKMAHEVQNGEYACTICYDYLVDDMTDTWTCQKCFTIFHCECMMEWISHGYFICVTSTGTRIGPLFLCPLCARRYEYNGPLKRRCWCAKSAEGNKGTCKGSCGRICGKPLNNKANKFCTLVCHPGPHVFLGE